jgi:16S rRNA (guanine966-N2)-methyltransferase
MSGTFHPTVTGEAYPMRIVGGTWAGIPLISPGGRVRPTSEEIRGPWLSHLEADLPEASVLDLFAGTGALGLEALSRGAGRADFVENGPAALHALKANVARLRIKGRARVFKKDVFAFLDGVHDVHYDLALADPPYASRLAERLLGRWLDRPFSRILSVEHAATLILPVRGSRRVMGDTAITTYRARKGQL